MLPSWASLKLIELRMFHLVNNDLPWQMEFTVRPINFAVTKNRQTFKPLHPHSTAENQSPLFIETNVTALQVTLATPYLPAAFTRLKHVLLSSY